MDIWYRKDTGLEYLYSRMQSEESSIKVAPLDPEISGDDPTMPSKDFGGDAKWGDIDGNIDDQQDLIQKLEQLRSDLEALIQGELSSIFIYRGQVATVADLPTDANVGDVYDVAENGCNYVWNGTTWDKLSETIDLSNYVKIEDLDDKLNLYYLKEEVDNLLVTTQEQLQQSLIEMDNKLTNALATQDGNLQALLLKMDELENKLIDTKSLDPEVVVLYEGGDTAYENKEKDFQLSGYVVAPTTIKGNTITLKETTITAATMSLLAANDVTISNTTVTGLIPKKISNSLFQIHADGYVALRDCTIDPESAYNGIEIGLSTGLAKSVTIENVDFSGHFVNNCINVFGMQDNGVITVANCHFTDVSNVFRLSNRTNAKYTLNIINCTIDKWETGEYSGMILLQDYTSTSAEQADEDNQFAKLTINIQNCTGPNGKIVPVDLATICGTQKDDQLIYMWDSYREHTTYGDKYPTITII